VYLCNNAAKTQNALLCFHCNNAAETQNALLCFHCNNAAETQNALLCFHCNNVCANLPHSYIHNVHCLYRFISFVTKLKAKETFLITAVILLLCIAHKYYHERRFLLSQIQSGQSVGQVSVASLPPCKSLQPL